MKVSIPLLSLHLLQILSSVNGLVAAMSYPWPQLAENVRRATPRDLQRLGVVAASGFFHSPVFPFERVYHKQYPGDTLIDYRKMLRSILQDPNLVLLVAIDEAVDESQRTPATILKAAHDEGYTETPTGKVVVGFASIKLNPSTKRNQSEEESWRKSGFPPACFNIMKFWHSNIGSLQILRTRKH